MPKRKEIDFSKMEGHTPGRWVNDNHFQEKDHTTRVAMPDVNGIPAATIAYCDHNWNDGSYTDRRISWKEAEANVALIAAAPDMKDEIIRQREVIERLANVLKMHHRRQCEATDLFMKYMDGNKEKTLEISGEYFDSAMHDMTEAALKEIKGGCNE